MKKFRQILILFMTLLSVSFISACSNDNDDVDESSIFMTTEPYTVMVLDSAFELDGITYRSDLEDTITFSEEYELIGYYVNESDLEYWMAYDNDSSLKYAVNDDNILVNKWFGEDLNDRFGLYAIGKERYIGLQYQKYSFYIYKAVFNFKRFILEIYDNPLKPNNVR